MKQYDLVIIGGGPAGLAAAVAAREKGIQDILLLEREEKLGGILNQCIHNGFGLHTFQEELTGPEYAHRFVQQLKEAKIPFLTETMVLAVTPEKKITFLNRQGIRTIQARAVILAMGCRERPRGALNIPGYRPQGIYSAGTAQKLVNIDGYLPGREVVILGSGDIGLIMARRMTLEGAKVKVVAELMPYSGGLKRNIVQCLDDFDIPLKLSHTVVNVKGKERLESVTIAQVDAEGTVIEGTQEEYACDTLLLSCGLIPENELSLQMGVKINPVTNGPVVNESLESNVEGVFACGNVLHVHDLVDFVSEEARQAGESAAAYLLGNRAEEGGSIEIEGEKGVRYTVPSTLDPQRMGERVKIRFRVDGVYRDCNIGIYFDGTCISRRKRQIMTPGEMEEVQIGKKQLEEQGNVGKIRITLETAEGTGEF